MFASAPVQENTDRAYNKLKSHRVIYELGYLSQMTNSLRKDIKLGKPSHEAIQTNNIAELHELLKGGTPWDYAHRDLDPLKMRGNGDSNRVQQYFLRLYELLVYASDPRCN